MSRFFEYEIAIEVGCRTYIGTIGLHNGGADYRLPIRI